MEVQGKILEIKDTQQVTDSFRKREFVLEYAENPQYPEFLKFELIQDRCDLVNEFAPGQDVSVAFNLKGRKWVNKQGETVYFNSLQAWRITAGAGAAAQPQQAQASGAPAPPPPAQEPEWLSNSNQNAGGSTGGAQDDDDLPF